MENPKNNSLPSSQHEHQHQHLLGSYRNSYHDSPPPVPAPVPVPVSVLMPVTSTQQHQHQRFFQHQSQSFNDVEKKSSDHHFPRLKKTHSSLYSHSHSPLQEPRQSQSQKVSSPSSYTHHLGKERQYWRDIILGINDGIISTFLLVIGVSGGGFKTSHEIFITAISGSLAGSISMFAGEYMATKSQDDVLRGEIKLENHHIEHFHSDEMRELPELLSLIGIPQEDTAVTTSTTTSTIATSRKEAHQEDNENKHKNNGKNDCGPNELRNMLLEFYSRDKDALLKIMVALEFGVLERERRNPLFAGLTSGCLFFIGSLPSVLPFVICSTDTNSNNTNAYEDNTDTDTDTNDNTGRAVALAIIGTSLALIFVGIAKSFATRMNWFYSSVENFIITGLGGVAAFYLGSCLQ